MTTTNKQKNIRLRSAMVMGLIATGILTMASAAEPTDQGGTFKVDMRGFGHVEAAKLEGASGAGQRFTCENPERATVLLHKIGRDLSQSATEPATWQQVKLGDVSAPVLVRSGLGSFLPTAKGNVVTVYTAPDGQAPETAFAKIAPELAGARFFDKDFRYPVYLDKFSHAGIGSYTITAPEGKPNTIDDHFAEWQEWSAALAIMAPDTTNGKKHQS